MKNVYVQTATGKKKRKITRTVDLGNGVHIDVNDKAGIVGVEVVFAKSVKVDGKEV